MLVTRSNTGLLAIEIDKVRDRFWPSKIIVELVNSLASDPTRSGSLFGRKSLQVDRNSIDGLVCHWARP